MHYPVVTLVLHFGYEKRWDAPVTLYDALDVPDIFKPYVPGVKINLFEIAFLPKENLDYFYSDFRVVADYFIQVCLFPVTFTNRRAVLSAVRDENTLAGGTEGSMMTGCYEMLSEDGAVCRFTRKIMCVWGEKGCPYRAFRICGRTEMSRRGSAFAAMAA